MAESSGDGVLADCWHPVFRHSAGRLGSQYLTALRAERRLVAWKSHSLGTVSLPPKNFGGTGEWLDVGPGATLLSFAPSAWVADSGEPLLKAFVLCRVVVDGAKAPMFALLKGGDNGAALERGTRLTARFRGTEEAGASNGLPDVWFEPVSGAGVPGAAA